MSNCDFIRGVIPKRIKRVLLPVRDLLVTKYWAEMHYWRKKLGTDGGRFRNCHFRRLMLALAEEADDEFLRDKVVADFGCGPAGSLAWARSASIRIGIDVMADRYADEFTRDILEHAMVYLKCTEKVIPLPSAFVDVMFTFNALDHVDSFPSVCKEILRVLKPGGCFIGGFNLEQAPTRTEPQRLTPERIRVNLLDSLQIVSYRITGRGPDEDRYRPLFDGKLLEFENGKPGYLWVKGRKPSAPSV